METFLVVIFLILAALVALPFILIAMTIHAVRLAAAKTPQKFAELILCKANSNPRAATDGSGVSIEFNLEAWPAAEGSRLDVFNKTAVNVVPSIFKKFPQLQLVTVVGKCGFVDIRGNRSVEPWMAASFTRDNSSTIKWSNINHANIPRLADSHWAHPSTRPSRYRLRYRE